MMLPESIDGVWLPNKRNAYTPVLSLRATSCTEVESMILVHSHNSVTLTEKSRLPVCPSAVARICAVPTATARTIPRASTVATVGALLAHVIDAVGSTIPCASNA